MNIEILPLDLERAKVDSLLTRNADLRQQNADQQEMIDILTDLNFRLMRALVAVLARRHNEHEQTKWENHERLLAELRDLRAMVVTESFSDARAVIASYGNSTTSHEAAIQ